MYVSIFRRSLKKVTDAQFKQITDVKRATFNLMCEIVEVDYKYKHQSRGRKSKLSIEDKVLMTLQYLREYPTRLSLAVHYGVTEGTVNTVTNHVERLLFNRKEVSLPEKQEWKENNSIIQYVVVDDTDIAIQRPKKSKKTTTLEKHTINVQLLVNLQNQQLCKSLLPRGRT